MIQASLLEKLTALAEAEFPHASFDFLKGAVYSSPLTAADRQNFFKLLDFARTLQLQDSLYETTYHQLLHLCVSNGSRLQPLKIIDRRMRGLAEEQGALMLISGPSGIGKTSLVWAFRERMRQLGIQFISVHCVEQESSSYVLWQEAVRLAASAEGPSMDALLAPIGKGEAARSSYDLALSLTDWLGAYASQRPTVFLFDDLQWADADSLELLNQLVSRLARLPILFIATCRSEETQRRQPLSELLPQMQRAQHFDHIQLEPLTRDDVERFVTAYHGACSPELAAYLYERAEGHPLFTVELFNDLVVQNMITLGKDGFWLPPEQTVPVPTFLKQLIVQRVRRAGPRVERLLSVVAVVGEMWQLNVVERMLDLPEPELMDALEKALQAEIILVEDDKAEIYRFSHGLIREVLQTQLLTRQRRRMHEQIAAQLEQQSPANVYTVAHHYYEAENWPKALTWCLAAGEESNRRLATHSALQWYQKALQAVEHVYEVPAAAGQIKIYDRLGRAYRALDQRKEAEIVFSRMRDFAQSSGDPIAEGFALVNLANIRVYQYQLDLAEKTAQEALKIGEQTQDAELLTLVHASLGGLFVIRGELDQAGTHLDQVILHADRLREFGPLLDTLRSKAYQSVWVGRYAEAKSFARHALELAQKSADSVVIAGASLNLAFAQIESGEYIEAYQNLSATLRAVELSGSHHHQVPRLMNLMGYLHHELGDAQEALVWDKKAAEAVRGARAQMAEMLRYSLLNQATDFLSLGNLDQALEMVARFEAIKEGADYAHFRYFNRYQLLMSEIHLAQHAYEVAVEQAHEARLLAQSHGMPKNVARSFWLEGQALAGLYRYQEGLDALEKAVEIVDGIRHASLRWKIRLSLAQVSNDMGRPAGETIHTARELIDQVVQSLSGSPLQDIFLVSPWLEELQALERNLAPQRPPHPAGLTDREVEILRLVASGATNLQVADVLHISVRTVNTHMTNILNKTGCSNRTAASAFALQHNLVSR